MRSLRHGAPVAGALAAAAAATWSHGAASLAGRRPEGGFLPPPPASCSRPLHCSAACGSERHKKLVRMYLNKRMNKFWYDNPKLDFQMVTKPSNLTNVPKGIPPKFSKEHSIRKRALDVLLLKAMRDLLGSYEVGQEIYDLHVELSKASIQSDFSACNLYWKSTGDWKKDEHVATVLNKMAGQIRSTLITQQVLRKVPFLVFIQDKEDAITKKIERLLATADFGPEEENDPVQSNISEQNSPMADTQWDSSHSSLHSNLFGIDHDALNEKIIEYKKRKKANVIEYVGLSKQQEKQLAEIRKQKKMKNKKVKTTPDDDLTPQKYLMDNYSEDDWDSEMATSEENLLYEEDELEIEDRTTYTK